MLTLVRFLLVSLSIAAILGEATIHLRQERLDIMTNGLGLDGAYDATLDRIKGQGKGKSALAMAALMWISRSERPMRVGELCEALAVKTGSRDLERDNIPSEKTLLGSCLGLVTIDSSSTVRLVHFTLQEYFNSHSEHFENPESTMAEICLTYLHFETVNKLSHNLHEAPLETRLLQYASSYWGLYAKTGLTEGVKLLALQLLGKFGRHISANLVLRQESKNEVGGWRHSEGFTGLHCVAYLGLDEIAIALLDLGEGSGIDIVDGIGRTPLSWAAEGGHEEMVRLLLNRKGVDPDSGDSRGRTPLYWAGGHEGIVKLLLDRKEVNPDSRNNYNETPLMYAAQDGHEKIVKLLLDRKEVNPDSRDSRGRTPLYWAGGHEGIVKLLLDRKEVSPDSRDNNDQTPLLCAAQGGHEGIVRFLLDRKEVNPDSRDNNDQTPLLCAAQGGHEGIVKLLLDRKEVNFNPRANYGLTALRWAAQHGNKGIVKLLQDRTDAESGTWANYTSIPLFHLLANIYEWLAVSLSPSSPGVAPNFVPHTAIAAAGIAVIAAILAITIRWWL